MHLISTILLGVSLSLTGIGILIYHFSGLKSAEKSRADHLVSLLQDGLHAFNNRIVSSIAQTLVYTLVVVLLFSKITDIQVTWEQLIAFILGGIIIMIISIIYFISSPQRVLSVIEKSKQDFIPGLLYQFNVASSVSFISVGSIISGFVICYLYLGITTILGYVSGISAAVFFHRICGGIYKASSDISSDIVNKYEKKLPGNDERNPATILNLIGSYAGKINGFNSDVLGSFLIALTSCLILAHTFKNKLIINEDVFTLFSQFPLFIVAISLLASFISYGYCLIRIKMKKVNNVLLEGLYVSILICCVSSVFYLKYIISGNTSFPVSWSSIFLTYTIGLFGAGLIGFTTEYFTSRNYKPSRKIASEAEYGSSVTFLNAYSVGLKSISFYFLYLILLIIPSHYLAGLYGVCLTSLGMVSVASTVLVINTFAPMSSVAQNVSVLADAKGQSIANCKRLHRIGETSVALGSGYSSGASVMSSLSLILVIITLSKLMFNNQFNFSINGLVILIGGLLIPFFANGFLIRKLSLLVQHTIEEVTRQFREIPYLFENKAKPDLTKASNDISRLSNDALIIPGLLIVLSPLIIGFFLRINDLIFYTLGLFLHTVSQSFFLGNIGEASNSAKHYIQQGNYGGPETETYENVQVADNIGDAFKDVLSPSSHIYLKTTVIIAALIIVFIY